VDGGWVVGAVPSTEPTAVWHHLTFFCVLVQPGDMNAMFAGIEERFGKRYEVPHTSTAVSFSATEDSRLVHLPLQISVLSRDPWVVTFDNFVTPEEGRALITATGGKVCPSPLLASLRPRYHHSPLSCTLLIIVSGNAPPTLARPTR